MVRELERIENRLMKPACFDNWAFVYFPRLQRVKCFVADHYAEPISLDTIAGVAGLEKTYFSRFFHEKTGVCYREWLGWYRVTRALDLIDTRDLTITEIAFAVGFQDLRTFERVFEKWTGECPREIKKRRCNGVHLSPAE